MPDMDWTPVYNEFMRLIKENYTNEKWFCKLPTEEKAKWLEEKMTWAAQEQGTFTAKGWEKWLKQPHKEKHNGNT